MEGAAALSFQSYHPHVLALYKQLMLHDSRWLWQWLGAFEVCFSGDMMDCQMPMRCCRCARTPGHKQVHQVRMAVMSITEH